jgi:outer membrane lipoprotein-sorting protein
MKQIKYILALILFIFIFQNNIYSITGSEAVTKLTERLKSTSTMEGIISISYASGITHSGIFKFKSPGHFNIKFSNPAGKQIISDSKKLWIYDESSRVCGVQDLSKSYSGGLASLIKGYFAVVNETGNKILIKLKSNNKYYSEINILVDKSYIIKKVVFKKEDGNGFSIILSNVKIGKAIHGNVFSFDVPANAQLIKNPLNIR